jgi:hypothetical protein
MKIKRPKYEYDSNSNKKQTNNAKISNIDSNYNKTSPKKYKKIINTSNTTYNNINHTKASKILELTIKNKISDKMMNNSLDKKIKYSISKFNNKTP